MGRILPFAWSVLFLVCGPAAATTFAAQVLDQDGKAVANAVVSLMPEARVPIPAASTRLAGEKFIDQRDETFIPLVTVIPKGGHIVFANNDRTTHQVYSFSPIKQFEITLARGEKSPSFAFETPGVAALGCNIHDHMIAYVFVAESPWTALTGEDGRAVIADVPAGDYQAQVWHPRFPAGHELPNSRVVLSGDSSQSSINVKLLSVPPMSHAHAANY